MSDTNLSSEAIDRRSLPRKMVVMRASLGGALALHYLYLLGGGIFPFTPQVPLDAQTKLVEYGLSSGLLVMSLLLAAGRWPRVIAGLIMIVRLMTEVDSLSYGRGWLITMLLLAILLTPAKKSIQKRTKLTNWRDRLLRISVCVACAYAAQQEFAQKIWIDSLLITSYVSASPLAVAFRSAAPGFTPLVEIIGGLAWLGQVVAPVLLWNRHLRTAVAVILIVLCGALQIFMPPAFGNCVIMVGLISFLPNRWLTMRRVSWERSWPLVIRTSRICGFLLIMLTMLCTFFERNVLQQFSVFEKVHDQKIEETYRMVTQPFVGIGNLILFNSMWKMYSPTWRHVVWIEWYQRKADQTVSVWPQENFSPEYRLHRRTWLETLWTDFKKEKVFVGMLSSERDKAAYGAFLCREIQARTGASPVSMHAEIYSFDIRPPDIDWSLEKQGVEQHQVLTEIPCDQTNH